MYRVPGRVQKLLEWRKQVPFDVRQFQRERPITEPPDKQRPGRLRNPSQLQHLGQRRRAARQRTTLSVELPAATTLQASCKPIRYVLQTSHCRIALYLRQSYLQYKCIKRNHICSTESQAKGYRDFHRERPGTGRELASRFRTV